MKSLQKISSRVKTDSNGFLVVSLYKDNLLDDFTYKQGENILMNSYNNFTYANSLILRHELKENEFTNQRFKDSVYHAVNNHIFATITPAVILTFDKAVHLRTYFEIAKEQKEFGNTIWKYYDKIDLNGACYYIHKHELKKYDITLPEYKPASMRGEPASSQDVPKPQTNNFRNNNLGNGIYLSESYSFIEGFNEIAREHNLGEIIKQ